ncbi:MAG: hypothetical protein RR998_09960 [Oscillospiraceae bacterium]
MLNINAPITVSELHDLDQINSNKNLVIARHLNANNTVNAADGNLTLAPNTGLDLQGTGVMKVKNLTVGDNSSILTHKAITASHPSHC